MFARAPCISSSDRCVQPSIAIKKATNSRPNELNSKLLDQYVFKNIRELVISDSTIGGIEKTLFTNFIEIETIQLRVKNLKDIFLKNNTEWISNLNQSTILDPEKQVLVGLIDDNDDSFEYPDDDFCLFKDFPHSSRVFTYIQKKNGAYKCTCTLLFLMQNWKQYRQFSLGK